MHVDNNQGQRVKIKLQDSLLVDLSDSVRIKYEITDTTKDESNLKYYYRVKGSVSWSLASIIGNVNGLDTTKYKSELIWNSKKDLVGRDTLVEIRVEIRDNFGMGVGDTIKTFRIDNNEIPKVVITRIPTEQSDVREEN